MARQPSADPHGIILGHGLLNDRPSEGRHKQLYFVEDANGNIIDIQEWRADLSQWKSCLGQFVRTVDGEGPDANGDVPQPRLVTGPQPSETGFEKQIGIDPDRGEIYLYRNGAWVLVGSTSSVLGTSRKHNLDPTQPQIADPTVAPGAAVNTTAGNLTGDYRYAYTWVGAFGETAPSPVSATVTLNAQQADVSSIAVGPEGTESRRLYRQKYDSGTATWSDLQLVTTIEDNLTTTYTDNVADADLGASPPASNDTAAHTGSLPEASVSFDATVGHDHDGTNSKPVSHANLVDITATDHHDNSNDPTIDEKGAMDNAEFPSATNPFLTRSAFGKWHPPQGVRKLLKYGTASGLDQASGNYVKVPVRRGDVLFYWDDDDVSSLYISGVQTTLLKANTLLVSDATTGDRVYYSITRFDEDGVAQLDGVAHETYLLLRGPLDSNIALPLASAVVQSPDGYTYTGDQPALILALYARADTAIDPPLLSLASDSNVERVFGIKVEQLEGSSAQPLGDGTVTTISQSWQFNRQAGYNGLTDSWRWLMASQCRATVWVRKVGALPPTLLSTWGPLRREAN
jgi:hypothetical protein